MNCWECVHVFHCKNTIRTILTVKFALCISLILSSWLYTICSIQRLMVMQIIVYKQKTWIICIPSCLFNGMFAAWSTLTVICFIHLTFSGSCIQFFNCYIINCIPLSADTGLIKVCISPSCLKWIKFTIKIVILHILLGTQAELMGAVIRWYKQSGRESYSFNRKIHWRKDPGSVTQLSVKIEA